MRYPRVAALSMINVNTAGMSPLSLWRPGGDQMEVIVVIAAVVVLALLVPRDRMNIVRTPDYDNMTGPFSGKPSQPEMPSHDADT